MSRQSEDLTVFKVTRFLTLFPFIWYMWYIPWVVTHPTSLFPLVLSLGVIVGQLVAICAWLYLANMLHFATHGIGKKYEIWLGVTTCVCNLFIMAGLLVLNHNEAPIISLLGPIIYKYCLFISIPVCLYIFFLGTLLNRYVEKTRFSR